MQLFQKSIRLAFLILLISAGATAAHAQFYTFPSYFKRDSLLSFNLLATTGKPLNFKTANKLSCFVFLSPDCPLSKNYSTLVTSLKEKYTALISFYLIVPGSSYTMDEIKTLGKTYLKNSVLYKDADLRLTHYLRATTTPEVVLLDSRSGRAVYAGALDNWAVSLGQQRAKATENYLCDAIERYLHNQPATVAYKQPVGCLINDF